PDLPKLPCQVLETLFVARFIDDDYSSVRFTTLVFSHEEDVERFADAFEGVLKRISFSGKGRLSDGDSKEPGAGMCILDQAQGVLHGAESIRQRKRVPSVTPSPHGCSMQFDVVRVRLVESSGDFVDGRTEPVRLPLKDGDSAEHDVALERILRVARLVEVEQVHAR